MTQRSSCRYAPMQRSVKGYERGWQFNDRFVLETQLDFLYKIPRKAIAMSRQRYCKFRDGSVFTYLKD